MTFFGCSTRQGLNMNLTSVNSYSSNDDIILVQALFSGHIDRVKDAIDKGADIHKLHDVSSFYSIAPIRWSHKTQLATPLYFLLEGAHEYSKYDEEDDDFIPKALDLLFEKDPSYDLNAYVYHSEKGPLTLYDMELDGTHYFLYELLKRGFKPPTNYLVEVVPRYNFLAWEAYDEFAPELKATIFDLYGIDTINQIDAKFESNEKRMKAREEDAEKRRLAKIEKERLAKEEAEHKRQQEIARWNRILSAPKSVGDKVCTRSNEFGYVEQISGDKVKLMSVGKLTNEKPDFFFDGDNKSFYFQPTGTYKWIPAMQLGHCGFKD